MPVQYPFDPTGVAPSNLVENEYETLTQINARPYRILVPIYAPFYLTNLQVEHSNAGTVSLLTEGVDYYACLPYLAAQRSLGKPVYGGLVFNNTVVNGDIRITYQTVGDNWCADRDHVYNRLLESVYNRRTTWWDVLTNVQEIFPPVAHKEDLRTLSGIEEFLNGLQKIEQAILSLDLDHLPGAMVAHIADDDLHHATKTSIGLGLVSNLPVASDQEVIALLEEDKYITLRQVVRLLKDHNLI